MPYHRLTYQADDRQRPLIRQRLHWSLIQEKRMSDLDFKTGKDANLIGIATTFISAFLTGFFRTTPHRTQLRHDKKLRDNLDEDQIDSMIDDSFPASDPPSSY